MPELAATTSFGVPVRVRVESCATISVGWSIEDGRWVYGHVDGVRVAYLDGELVFGQVPGTPESLLRLLLLGVGLTMALVARRVPVLHATTVVLGDRTIALVGASGVGKSSFTAALIARGARLLTDDVSALDARRVRAGFGRIKLWPDTAQHFGFDPGEYPRVHPGFEKRSIEMPVQTEAAELTDVVLLERGPAGRQQLRGGRAVQQLLANHRLPQVLDAQAQAGWLGAVTDVVGAVPVYQVSLPGSLRALERAADDLLLKR